MNVFWFVADIEEDKGELYSKLASVRLRCLMPLKFMGDLVSDCNVSLYALNKELNFAPGEIESCDVAIIGKAFKGIDVLVSDLKRNGALVVLDLCDDPFELKHLSKVYSPILPQADIICAASRYLGDKLHTHFGDKVCVIEDPIEIDSMDPVLPDQPASSLGLSWFGQAMNLKALVAQFNQMNDLPFDSIHIDLVTNAPEEMQASILNLCSKLDKIQVRFIDWSHESTERSVLESHIVVLPVVNDEWAKSKTANRAIMAIQLGRPCVVGNIPSYKELEKYITVDDDLSAGILGIVNNWSNQAERLTQAQSYVSKQFAPSLISEKWAVLLNYCQEQISQADTDIVNIEPIRLNLGCGDKILDGYTNVDLVDERAGRKPDVMCDIRNLEVFPSNYADEILNVHVIEHFYYWEAKEVLSEWVRVLKPGGRMIIECPNLLTACEEVLRNPRGAVGPGKAGQKTMWVFYGDPAWKDPLMCHKWLYTPHSLAELMESCGLHNIRQEPAQFKLREPRDMRLVGEKK